MEDYKIVLGALLDANAKGDIDKQLNAIKDLSVTISKATLSNDVINDIKRQLTQNGIDINLVFGNTSQITNQAKQTGQQIGQQISQGISQAVTKSTTSAKKELESFSELYKTLKAQSVKYIDENTKKNISESNTLKEIQKTYESFGNVRITDKIFDKNNGNLKSFKVNIEQVNGELKETRSFMMALNDVGDEFVVQGTTFKGAEKLVHHLDEAKNATNETGEALNRQKEKLAEQAKYYDKLKDDTKLLYNLKQKLLSADESETAELNKQIKAAKQRVSYSNKQIDKKGLRDNTLDREVNDLVNSNDKKLNVKFAEALDSTSSSFTTLKAKWQEQGILVDDFKSKVETLEKSLNNISADDVSGLNTIKQQLSALSSEADNLVKVNKIQLSFENGTYEAKVESVIAKTRQWVDEQGNARISTANLSSALETLNKAYINITSEGGNTIANQEALRQAEANLSNEIKKVTNEVTKMNAEYAKSSKVESFHQKLTEFYDKNTATHRKWGAELKQMMEATASGAKIANSELSNMELRFKQISNEARQSGKLGLSFFDGIKQQAAKFTQWVSVTSVVMKGVQAVRGAVDNVIELDDALLELSKVSDLSAEGLENVTNQAYELGEKVGKTGRQVIDAVTEFKRAGYEMQDSLNMAEAALVMTNVAEGINDTADAAGTLISVLKGYNMSESDAMSIVDMMNSTSNQSPIGFDELAEGLERTAGTMAQSGTTIQETIGLITAGYAQLRNVEKVSTSLITLSARLRGVNEDGEEIDGLSTELQESFGKIGVAIEDTDGNLRSIYAIAKDYAKVLPTLTSKQKQYYAELAAGKRNVTTWNAITQQFQDAENATAQAIDSVGSASEENSKYLDSISGKYLPRYVEIYN